MAPMWDESLFAQAATSLEETSSSEDEENDLLGGEFDLMTGIGYDEQEEEEEDEFDSRKEGIPTE